MSMLESVWRVATRGKRPGQEISVRKCPSWETSWGKGLKGKTGV